MKRLILLALVAGSATLALGAPASAAAKCVLIPDAEGHVWELCLR